MFLITIIIKFYIFNVKITSVQYLYFIVFCRIKNVLVYIGEAIRDGCVTPRFHGLRTTQSGLRFGGRIIRLSCTYNYRSNSDINQSIFFSTDNAAEYVVYSTGLYIRGRHTRKCFLRLTHVQHEQHAFTQSE